MRTADFLRLQGTMRFFSFNFQLSFLDQTRQNQSEVLNSCRMGILHQLAYAVDVLDASLEIEEVLLIFGFLFIHEAGHFFVQVLDIGLELLGLRRIHLLDLLALIQYLILGLVELISNFLELNLSEGLQSF